MSRPYTTVTSDLPALDPADADGRSRMLAEFGLAVMVLIWGLNFVVAKWALAVIDPLAFNALRHILAAAFMYAAIRSTPGPSAPDRADLPRIVTLGIVGHIFYQMAFIIGLDHTRAGNASLMLALVPIFLLLISGPRNAARIAWVGAALSVCGVALVSANALQIDGSTTLFGDLLMVGAAVVWATYTWASAPLIARYGPIRSTAWTLWIGAIGLTAAGVPGLLSQDWGQVGLAEWGGVFFSAILSIGLAYLLWYRGVQVLGGARTAVFSNLTPAVALIAGALFLHERLTALSIAGTILVLCGILLVRRGRA